MIAEMMHVRDFKERNLLSRQPVALSAAAALLKKIFNFNLQHSFFLSHPDRILVCLLEIQLLIPIQLGLPLRDLERMQSTFSVLKLTICSLSTEV